MAPRRRARALDTAADDEPEVAALAPAQRARLLAAFEQAGRPSSSFPGSDVRRRKRRRVGRVASPAAGEPEDEGGGFIVDAAAGDGGAGGGGFIPDDDDNDVNAGGSFLPDDAGDTGGGFLPEDDAMGGGGGFLPEDDDDGAGGFLPSDLPPPVAAPHSDDNDTPPSAAPARTHLPLSLVSDALRRAGLPPSDPEVLAFFRQSAEGWGADAAAADAGGGEEEEAGEGERQGVSLKDWMSVCAVLLASRGDDEDEEGGMDIDPLASDPASSDLSDPADTDADFTLDPDDAVDPEANLGNPARRRTRRTAAASREDSPVGELPEGEESEASDEDEDDGAAPARKKAPAKAVKKRGKAARASAARGVDGRPALSRAEKRAAREAFALFLPPAGPGEDPSVEGRVLTERQVANVVMDLKETMTADDVREMVRVFSTVLGGKALTLTDFETLMWEGNLFHLMSG